MSATSPVAAGLIQLIQQLCSPKELKVSVRPRLVELEQSAPERRVSTGILFGHDEENGDAIDEITLNFQRRLDGGHWERDTVFSEEAGCLSTLKQCLSAFGGVDIQCLVTEVSGSMLSVDISYSKYHVNEYEKIATALIDQVKDQITDIELV